MRAALDDAAVFEDHDGVGVADGGQAVRDHKRGAATHDAVHTALDELFGARVDGARGLVQDEHRRVGNGHARDGEQLALALRQVGAVSRDRRVVAPRQAADKRIRAGGLSSGAHLLVGRVELAKADVLRNGAAKQVRVLQHNAKRPAQAGLGDMLDVDAVVRDLAVINLVETVDEVGDGRLTGACGAHKRNLLPRLGKQVEIREYAGARHVGKVHGVEAHVTGKRDQAARELGTVGSHCTARLINSSHIMQVPVRAHALALGNLPRPRGVARLHQLHAALVHLGLKIHGGKQALSAGQRVE